VQLVGNSVADEAAPCLRTILERRGYAYRGLTSDGAAICDFLPTIRSQLTTAARPDIAIIYSLPTSTTPCMQGLPDGPKRDAQWARDVERAVHLWLGAGVPVVALVPPVAQAATSGESPLAARYRAIARRLGSRVRILDAGTFIRDQAGVSQWRMPCVPGGEQGCDAQMSVAVRLVIDGGIHMCSDPAWRGGPCPPVFSGGDRRVAAALAASIVN
jgi:hypothetical protein